METKPVKRGRPVGTFKGKYARKVGGVTVLEYQIWKGLFGVCQRWQGEGGYDNFRDDVGVRPDGCGFARLDESKEWGPDNFAWRASAGPAGRRLAGGPSRDADSLAGKCRSAGLPYLQVYNRIHKLGWSEEKALATPIRRWRMAGEEMAPHDLPDLKFDKPE